MIFFASYVYPMSEFRPLTWRQPHSRNNDQLMRFVEINFQGHLEP